MSFSKELFENFSKNFNLVLPVIVENQKKVIFETKEEISKKSINEFLEKFFLDNGFTVKKNNAGYLFIGKKERFIVSVTNFSDKRPFCVIISLESF